MHWPPGRWSALEYYREDFEEHIERGCLYEHETGTAPAGPTPVSALIHAATMVTAGVYLIARTNPLFELAPAVMALVGIIGAVTLLVAGFSALTQYDVKRILAEAVRTIHRGLSRSQTGRLRWYIGMIVAGAVIILLVTFSIR